jgi:repressor of nif and glnA expression
MNTDLGKLYPTDIIKNVYKLSGLPVGSSVKVEELDKIYENYLRKDEIDLVVFSKTYFDTIVYD